MPFLNPCVNRSRAACAPEDGSVRLGLELIKEIGTESAGLIVDERERHGPYVTAGDLVRRTGLRSAGAESLVMAGAFDAVAPNRRQALWEAELHTRPSRKRPGRPARFHGGRCATAPRFHAAREDDGRVPCDGHLPRGPPDGVREAGPWSRRAPGGGRRGARRGRTGHGRRLAGGQAAPARYETGPSS